MARTLRKIKKFIKHPIRFVKDSVLFSDKVVPRSGVLPEGINPEAGIDFVLYFPAKLQSIYQLQQWLPALHKLAESGSVMILVRKQSIFRELHQQTTLPICYCHKLDELMELYDNTLIRTIIYVNNAVKNFQSLINHRALHVHINHGESEKSCMYSNQAKAYDYVFVVSDAGLERYRNYLSKLDEDKFLKVGRPQLDYITPIDLNNPQERTVVLYAPTWAATHASMDYASVSTFGKSIVDGLINNEKYFFIYRPHPSIGASSKIEHHEDAKIKKAIQRSDHAEIIMDVDINRIFPVTDIAIFDNSSVAIDYLKSDKPMIMTDFFNNHAIDQGLPPIAQACRLIPPQEASKIESIVFQELKEDTKKDERHRVCQSYLGNFADGEATRTFIAELQRIKEESDRLNSR